MKITKIYKQKVESLKNDILNSISRYFKELDIKMVTMEDVDEVFILTKDKITTITSDDEDYLLSELQIESLLFILEKLENVDYIKNE